VKKTDLKVGDRVILNFKKATNDAKNHIFVSNVEKKIEQVKNLGTGCFLVDQLTELGEVWIIAEDLDIGDICVNREALRRRKK